MTRRHPPPTPTPANPATPATGRVLRILLVRDPLDADPLNVETIRSGLVNAGFTEIQVVDADLRLPDVITASQPDMLIIASESAARDTIEHVCVSTQHAPRPIVLFTDNDDSQRIKAALSAGITAYIVDGLRAERVKTVLDVAYARFELDQQLRAELDATRLKLAERKVVERAKGLLMQARGLSEEEAYKRLRSMAMERGLKLVDAAQRVIDVMG
ncbi:ANTAR domain-containing response regulator [Cupriavidus taiwanensis]|uniref:Response regulator antiterminator transcriptional regulator, RNA-binding ANTAR domain n=1 Tax=Cupriavidus taiwanensis TaxID=164546 RepID=A0A7Z7J8L7_9BURK|nr:ANTAR domain-containing protein [Cupriavidus taiwanensis]SOY54365.1 response regulator antiterminator transcriptional regulator, RNA-binding ANTAR domain [Cupriavidus taiwanensis]SOY87401.1 response regulator antiterminator transcriptional regulator, RNA-binding ANTAR domain [Cupriavidus taiwanensis]SOZ01181.1 response regulator antiterminator transcriptional regulator, RNA-binding ANTAR domain [Cupriavidus taiwanensis]SOZ04094.1 response regulator antiterminator transcriptional regulator, R